MLLNHCAAPMITPRSWVSQKSNFLIFVAANYAALDAVFFEDCPLCAVNLKTMWCEYACNPDKASFGKSINLFNQSPSSLHRHNRQLGSDLRACHFYVEHKLCLRDFLVMLAGVIHCRSRHLFVSCLHGFLGSQRPKLKPVNHHLQFHRRPCHFSRRWRLQLWHAYPWGWHGEQLHRSTCKQLQLLRRPLRSPRC